MNKDTKTNETQEQKLNFHDLIDAAMQAYKDGFLTSVELNNLGINATVKPGTSTIEAFFNSKNSNFTQRIQFLKSFYKETFIIKSESDIKRIDTTSAEIEYLNGFKFKVKAKSSCGKAIVYQHKHHGLIKICINELRGATVTQKKIFH